MNDSSSPFIQRLADAHQVTTLPDGREAERFLGDLLGLLFPHFSERYARNPQSIASELQILEIRLAALLQPLQASLPRPPMEASRLFFEQLPDIHEHLSLDAEAIYQGDPAATSIDEVIIAYPGFFAICVYRVAHALYTLQVPALPRMLSEYAHQRTGIDIHPGAAIGRNFCIDHGTGIVIGETTEISDNVKIYQGVTLGALSVEKQLAKRKRHPTIEANVVIYSNATILGGETVIGANTVVGGNVWLTASVPPNSTVYHKSEVKVHKSGGAEI